MHTDEILDRFRALLPQLEGTSAHFILKNEIDRIATAIEENWDLTPCPYTHWDLTPCPYTHSHTRNWCNHFDCRKS